MSKVTCFRNETYKENTDTVLAPYIRQMTKHISFKFPNLSPEKVKSIVTKIAKERFKDPIIKRVRFPSEGNHILESVPLSQHTKEIRGMVTSPSGNSYCRPSERKSILGQTLDINVAIRDKAKAKMLAARESGDIPTATKANGEQNARKVLNNAAAGGHKNPHNFVTDRSGFNAITSISRMSVRCGYGSVERMLTGNVYLPSYQDTLSYIYRMIEVMPVHAEEVIRKFSLNTVDTDTLFNWLAETISYYTNDTEFHEDLRTIIETLSPTERTFIYCGGSLYHLLTINTNFFRNWIDETTSIPTDIKDIPVSRIKEIEGTISIMVRSANIDLLGVNEKGKPYTLQEAIEKNPEGIMTIIALADKFFSQISEISDIISTFIKIECEPPQLAHNARLVRKCVVTCDTDSNIATSEKLIRWYFGLEEGKIIFNKKSYEINAFAIFCMSKYLEHAFARLSTNIGMEGNDIFRIIMKNEYLFPVFIRTYISKHYTALMEQQEGKQLPEMDLELKGVNFKGSMRTLSITKTLGKHMEETMERIIKTNGQLSSYELLKYTADQEKIILQSLKKGELEYLTTQNIKPAGGYGNDLDKSPYFYYEMWEEVFADHFKSHVTLPNRFFKLPLKGEDKFFKSSYIHETLKKDHPKLYKAMMEFFKKKGNKFPKALYIPPSFPEIPNLFRDWIDINQTIINNMSPFYLWLSSFNICPVHQKLGIIVSNYIPE